MTGDDFQFLANLLKRDSGLALDAGRIVLMESRLRPLAERHGFVSTAALVHELRQGNETLSHAVSEALTIHDTGFFRDEEVFATLRDRILPSLLESRLESRRLRIWCAAAATGQEPYSLAMILDCRPQLAPWDIEIIATDVSPEAIARARDGLYTTAEVQRGLPVRLLARYFQQEAGSWRVVESLRSKVNFLVFNLFDSFADLGVFDLILCRNVLIYFDPDSKAGVLSRLSQCLADDGYLMLGAGETVRGLCNSLKPLEHDRGINMKAHRFPRLRKAAMG